MVVLDIEILIFDEQVDRFRMYSTLFQIHFIRILAQNFKFAPFRPPSFLSFDFQLVDLEVWAKYSFNHLLNLKNFDR